MNESNRTPSGALITACDIEDGCQKLTCEVCLQEVPADAAKSMDVQDYVYHFCGLECFDAWQKRGKAPR